MAESIRSLTVKLGYDIDTTGADIFKARFKTLTADAKRTADILERAFKPKRRGKIVKGPLEKRLDRLNAKIGTFKRKLKRAFKIDKAVESDLKLIGDKLKTGFGKLKIIALAGAAAVAAATVKVFTGFADIQQARLTLAFRSSKAEADEFIDKIGSITEATGGVVSQLDALNAVSFGGNITDNIPFFVENLAKIIKLSKVAGVDFGEASNAIARFIETGTGLDDLVNLEVISAKQKEALIKSGTAGTIGQQGITARTAQAGAFLGEGEARVNEFFEIYKRTANAAVDQMKTSAENLIILAGEKAEPIVTDFVQRVNQITKKGISLLTGLEDGQKFTIGGAGSRSRDPNINITNNTTVNGDGKSAREIAIEVNREQNSDDNKKVIENSLRKTEAQALNTDIKPSFR